MELAGILEAVTNTFLKAVGDAIEKKDIEDFKTAYTQTMVGCYACHAACEKPFLRLHIPESPGATVIDSAPPTEVAGANGQTDDVSRGKSLFQQNCALCHAVGLGPRNVDIGGQGPSLV